MDHDTYPDAYIRGILESVKAVAIVGASTNTVRPSAFVVKYLLSKGYRVYPINPGSAGQTMAGATFLESLAKVPEPIDMVDIFRRSEAVMPVVEEALALSPRPRVIWMQLGIRNDAAAALAEAAGLQVVMNRCPKIEYARLSGEIGWAGVNSRTISARKPEVREGFQHFGLRPGK